MAKRVQSPKTTPPTTFELLKFILAPVFVERNGTGKVVGEQQADPIVFYGSEPLAEWLETGFPVAFAELNARGTLAPPGENGET